MHAYQGNLCVPDDPSPAAFASPEFSSFDVAAVGLGFHHFDDPSLAARRLAERLKTGGVLVILDFFSHEKMDVSLLLPLENRVSTWERRKSNELTRRNVVPCRLRTQLPRRLLIMVSRRSRSGASSKTPGSAKILRLRRWLSCSTFQRTRARFGGISLWRVAPRLDQWFTNGIWNG